jgi:hypothetical protein
MRSLSLWAVSLLALVPVLISAPEAPGAAFDANGTYWLGWVGSSPSGPANGTLGQWTIGMTSPTTGSFSMQAQTSGGPLTGSGVITNWSYDAQNWANITAQFTFMDSNDPTNDPNQGIPSPLAVTANTMVNVDRVLNDHGDLGVLLLLRQNNGVNASDLPGAYAMFGQDVLTNNNSGVWWGTLNADANGRFTTSNYEPNVAIPKPGWGTWTLDANQPMLHVLSTKNDPNVLTNSFQLYLGTGGVADNFVTDPNQGLGDNVLLKLGSNKTISQAAGHWLAQAFLTDPNGVPETIWGTVDIDADGNFISSISTSLHPLSNYSDTGYIVMDSNGMFTIYSAPTVHGALNLDGDLMVVALDSGTSDSEDVAGIMFLSRAVPEPLTLGLLAAGSTILFRRRRAN